MANIQKLTYPYFTDGSTQLNAANLNPIIAKLNEVIDKVNGGVTPTQTVATPTISISGTTATISCSTSGATIYYTTNGNTPTTSSTQYSSAITLTEACTIKAIAVKSGMNNSSVASATYNPSATVQPPTIYIRDWAVIMTAESGATIYYTIDGSVPTSNSTQYTGAFTNADDCTIKAIAIKDGASSSVASESFIAAHPSAGYGDYPIIVLEGNQCTILINGVGNNKYTIDGGSETVYTGPFTLESGSKVVATSSSTQGGILRTKLTNNGHGSVKVTKKAETTTFPRAYINRNDSTSSVLKINYDAEASTVANVITRFYDIQQGRKYTLELTGVAGSTLPTGYLGYANSIPSSIETYVELSGKYDSNAPVPTTPTTVVEIDVTAENYSYLVTTGSKYEQGGVFAEILKD